MYHVCTYDVKHVSSDMAIYCTPILTPFLKLKYSHFKIPQIGDFVDQKHAAATIFEYIEVFYNRIRAHSTIRYLAPAEFEEGARYIMD